MMRNEGWLFCGFALLSLFYSTMQTSGSEKATDSDAEDPPIYIEGQLLDARSFFDTNSADEHERYAAFANMSLNLPAIVVTEEGVAYYLVARSNKLSKHAGKHVRVSGPLIARSRLILPRKLSVQNAGDWHDVTIRTMVP